MAVPEGFKTAEEIAVDVGKSVYLISQIAKDLGLQKVIFPDDNRRRFSPENVKAIKDAVATRRQMVRHKRNGREG